MAGTLKFPDGFFWGAATSSHQVEGGQSNDWSEWEKLGKVSGGERSGRACDHWNRYTEDFDSAKELGHNAHRLSIEWSRVEPMPGEWNDAALAHYRNVVRALKERSIEPFVTLWHFTNPRWFMKLGGWESPQAPELFTRYAQRVVRALPDVKFWMTLNEPNVYALLSYLVGYWPPEVKQWRRALRVYRTMAEAHRLAYTAIKRANPKSSVGIANSAIDYVPARPSSVLDRWMVRFCDRWYNRWFIERTLNELDFIGVNHYFRQGIRVQSLKHPVVTEPRGEPLTDYGWGICPEAMYKVLTSLGRYRMPLYITENGLADAHDQWRREFIMNELKELYRAISCGVDVRGYFYWSFLDNFEWREGFTKRFGLVEVDFQTQQRTIRPSARWFALVCRSNILDGTM
ncbi:MAG: glycoside hydrolase family 1 protein [Candidatus Kerfeldbacteria bacterium]